MKLLVDTRADKVLFAEARKEFVDFLCHLLLLPLGNVIRQLTTSVPEKTMVGCIGNVHQSYKNLAENYMLPYKKRDTLLNPGVSKVFCSVPLLWSNNSGSSDPKKFYICTNNYHPYFTEECGYPCPSCSNSMKEGLEFRSTDAPNNEQGYVKGLARYMVTDDLCIAPLSLVSCTPVLNMSSVEHPSKLEGKVVEFGVEEVRKYLFNSFTHPSTMKKQVYYIVPMPIAIVYVEVISVDMHVLHQNLDVFHNLMVFFGLIPGFEIAEGLPAEQDGSQ